MKPTKDQKVLLIILILVALLTFGYQLWLRWPDKVIDFDNNPKDSFIVREQMKSGEEEIIPTADPKWNLYRNFKYGFQIQYPAEWDRISIYNQKDQNYVLIGFGEYGQEAIISIGISNTSLDFVLSKIRSNDRYVRDELIWINNMKIFKGFNRNPNLDYETYGYIYDSGDKVFSISGAQEGTASSWYLDRMIETIEVFQFLLYNLKQISS